MGRPLRIEYPGALYHITSRGNEKRKIFFDDEDKQKFLEILKDYHDRFNILIHSYSLMDNHYHLILETPKGNLLKIMHGINSNYTGYFNRKYGRAGHLFQGRYKGILIDKDEYLVQLGNMIISSPSPSGQGEGCLPYATQDVVDTGHGWITPKGKSTGSVAGTTWTLFAYYNYNPLELK